MTTKLKISKKQKDSICVIINKIIVDGILCAEDKAAFETGKISDVEYHYRLAKSYDTRQEWEGDLLELGIDYATWLRTPSR